MAPKKGGKKDGKKDKKDEASAEMTEKDLLDQARLRIESLETQLTWREEKTAAAVAAQKELQQKVAHYHADFEREKEEIFDISADMTRQYKGMQEELIAQVNKLENTIAEQKDELERSQLQLEEVSATAQPHAAAPWSDLLLGCGCFFGCCMGADASLRALPCRCGGRWRWSSR